VIPNIFIVSKRFERFKILERALLPDVAAIEQDVDADALDAVRLCAGYHRF